jgi:small subunit ribosomal protein S7
MSKRAPSFTPAHSNELIETFVNYLMKQGKKTTARSIFHDCMEIVKTRGYTKPMESFEKAIRNISPTLEVKAKRIGGSVYQIPIEVQPKRQLALAFRWMLGAAREKKGAPLARRLANEIIEACENTGLAIKKKEDTFKMAQANKAFAHLAKY